MISIPSTCLKEPKSVYIDLRKILANRDNLNYKIVYNA